MALPLITSPHALGNNRSRQIMLQVLLAAGPGLLTLTWLYGFGTLITLLWASACALGFEALALKLRRRPVKQSLQDYSALVTALLLALALPPYSPWWLTLLACGFALLLGKQLYGGLGQNPFNPAMVGYVVALVSFPQEMTRWPAIDMVGPLDAFGQIFNITPLPDGWAQATALDVLKINDSLTQAELWSKDPAFGYFAAAGSEWVNLAFLAGGLYLLLGKRLFSWHAPLGMLGALAAASLLFWNGQGSDSHGSPLLHLLSGATMLGAFFIVTDPVSGATSKLGRLIFGMGVGLLVYLIRAWGGYPDGVAFAVLLMNLAAPTLDYYTRPRSYGQHKPKRGFTLGD